ncbi:GDSL-type esterase/lipase family protein [Furfurilactobacillus siliginis]|uniref:Ethanolamine utilization protein EutQ n=1 Tax=Furfurilactobacillus siliginis TaxID=348151 RepID=A0A0R2L6C9_9LACO|nr:GDSL-type esterase/lipase family protein [Furfurilactobacillus siliginis]KRN97009.1 hypothetical protein IV55_GL000885 [Furfurilactobacillus siliginis]GEK27768.1 ethanolamine utilization protein EutQ [Furfurilactobacillus siliginis]
MKHFRALIITLLVLAAAVAGIAAWWLYQSGHQVSEQKHQPVPMQSAPKAKKKVTAKKSVKLVALGDSLTEGVGDQRKQGGYVGQIKRQLTTKQHLQVTATNYGKAGDRSDQIQKRLTNSLLMQKKVQQADAIVMTVGGNDLMQGLQNASIKGNTSPVAMDKSVQATQAIFAGKLTQLLNQVRQLNPDAPIFLFSVYNPVYVYFANVEQLSAYVLQFVQTTQQTVQQVDRLYFMDINDQLSYGQYTTPAKRAALAAKDAQANKAGELNGAAVEKALVGGTSGELNDYLSPVDHFHPNNRGYSVMTNVLYKTMMKHDQWLPKK